MADPADRIAQIRQRIEHSDQVALPGDRQDEDRLLISKGDGRKLLETLNQAVYLTDKVRAERDKAEAQLAALQIEQDALPPANR